MANPIIAGSVELERNLKTLIGILDGQSRITALMQGGFVVEAAAKANVQEHHLIDSGNLRASIGTIPLDSQSVGIGPQGVEYAAIHEFGGDVHPAVTPRLRKFAWAKYRETGEEKYKGMALTKKARLDVHIPAKPYLRPALDENKERIFEQIGNTIRALIDGAVA